MSFFLNWSDEAYEYVLTTPGYIALALIAAAVFFLVVALRDKNGRKLGTREITFCAAAIALAAITSLIRITTLPFGGSITLCSMLVLSFVGYVFGPKIGVTAGAAYGILYLILETYIYHPAQVLLDYVLAFAALGLSGFFADKKNGLLKGYVVGVTGRYICHVISGYIFFAEFAPEGLNPLIYTLLYNLTYILPEMVVTVILLCIPSVSSALKRVKAYTLGDAAGGAHSGNNYSERQ
ncbi:MAG: energy-coupled thiamine transporter ThiT [Lachnospiraceae bacterium]|nr:energy-coupled thiamine transporter ThiT [Lachnospiraceae bacterium]MBQ7261487.1 energy-coupled thiamine transporter ThiT [Lachnospiraceae bacterium]HAV00592.1 energy-coupled thiamine transporter ThiT [Lachnospiraceae bacterium]